MQDDAFICPICGEDVPANAAACPHCGSDENTGWSDQTIYDGTGIEDPDDFDYEEFLARERDGKTRSPAGRRWGGWLPLVILLVLILFILAWVL